MPQLILDVSNTYATPFWPNTIANTASGIFVAIDGFYYDREDIWVENGFIISYDDFDEDGSATPSITVEINDPRYDVIIHAVANQVIETYNIQTVLIGVTGVSSNPTSITSLESKTLTFTANPNYTLPDNVSVQNATLESWNKSTGELKIKNPKG